MLPTLGLSCLSLGKLLSNAPPVTTVSPIRVTGTRLFAQGAALTSS